MVAGPALLVAQDGDSTRIILNALLEDRQDVELIIEKAPSRLGLLRRRARKLGVTATLGQALFAGTVVPLLKLGARARIETIVDRFAMDRSPPRVEAHRVESVNSPETRELMQRIDPSVVVVSGTRIIGRRTLNCVAAPFVNMHAGITPLYRGVHGGYWALAEDRAELAGTTVHLVDDGIDTGRVIGQSALDITREDSFVTYPYLHVAAGLPLLREAVARISRGEPLRFAKERQLPSRLRHHPTLWGYLSARVSRGIR
ncbi:MAG: formyl transferase [Candidatus Eisenbacteria bacterium]